MFTKVYISELETITPFALASADNFQPLGLIGAVGIAKTQWLKTRFVELYADHHGLSVDKVTLISERVANRDSAELAGVALPTKDASGNLFTQFTIPPLLTRINAELEAGAHRVIVLFDELLQAPADVQKVLADVLDPDERSIAGWPLPDQVDFVFTGNRTKDKSGATRMLSHLLNRCMVFELAFDINSWAGWARDNGVNPLLIDCAVSHTDFFDDSVPTEDGPFCTPRSLVNASRSLSAFMESDSFDGGFIPSYIEKLLSAKIGTRAASLVCEFVRLADKVPQGSDIINDPHGANVPDETGFQLLAGNRAIASCYNAETGEAALEYIVRLRADIQVSLGTKLLYQSSQRGWALNSDTSVAFNAKYSDLLPLAFNKG